MCQSARQARRVLAGYTRWAPAHHSRTLIAARDSAASAPTHGATSKDMFLGSFTSAAYHIPVIAVLIACSIWRRYYIIILIRFRYGGHPGLRCDARKKRECLVRRRRARRARHSGHGTPPFRRNRARALGPWLAGNHCDVFK